MTDAINPKHYQRPNGQQVIDAIKIIVDSLPPYEGYLVGSVIKYLSRYRQKGDPIENLKKGGNFLQFLIDEVERSIAIDVAAKMAPEQGAPAKAEARHWGETDALSTLREIAAKLPRSEGPVERRQGIYEPAPVYHGMTPPK